METPKPEESEETRKESTAEAETILTSAVEQEVMRSVPKLYKAGARQLLDKIKEHRDVLNWNEKGELMYENKPHNRVSRGGFSQRYTASPNRI